MINNIVVCRQCATIVHATRLTKVTCNCANQTYVLMYLDENKTLTAINGGNDAFQVINCITMAQAKRISQTLSLQHERDRARAKTQRDRDMCVSLIQTIDMNINNGKLSDKEFREFVRRSLPVTVKPLTNQAKG